MCNPSDRKYDGRRGRRQTAAFAAVAGLAVLLAWWTAEDRRSRRLHNYVAHSATGGAAPVAPVDTVSITEFLARNVGGLRDEDGDSPDWIELHNAGDAPVSLGGWSLTNEARRPGMWTFPSVTLEPGEYLIVFASGKDRRRPSAPLHTNFTLAPERGYLGLYPPEGISGASHAYFPRYPRQVANVSFGRTDSGLSYFSPPTPGSGPEYSERFAGVVADVQFSAERGLYRRGATVRLSTPTPDAEIRYTLDGSEPTPDSGEAYRGGIVVRRTTPIRAAAFKPEWIPAPATAHTIIVPDTIAAQEPPAGYPDTWEDELPADYAMDTIITEDPRYASDLVDAFYSIPSLSIAVDPRHLFDPETGIYVNTENDGMEWERPISLEFIDPESSATFQINAGLRIHGRSSRKPLTTPKRSFRVVFRAQYGSGKLRFPLFGSSAATEFDTLVLSATSNYSWTFPLGEQRTRGQYVRDSWAKETQRIMGHRAPHTRYVHLFINGLYWGLYNISERPDANFMASYFGGRAEDYDVRKGGETVDGDDRAWRTLIAMAANGFETDEAYDELRALVNIDNFVDYLILNHYAGNENWDFGNWYAARRRAPGEQFRFCVWDMENVLGRLGENSVFIRHRNRPTEVFHRLRDNPAFRARFEERVRLHFTGDGALTPANAAERYARHAERIELAIVAESARWGDYRLDLHPYRTGPFERYTRDRHWRQELSRLQSEYFPNRTAIVIEQYRNAGLFSE